MFNLIFEMTPLIFFPTPTKHASIYVTWQTSNSVQLQVLMAICLFVCWMEDRRIKNLDWICVKFMCGKWPYQWHQVFTARPVEWSELKVQQKKWLSPTKYISYLLLCCKVSNFNLFVFCKYVIFIHSVPKNKINKL